MNKLTLCTLALLLGSSLQLPAYFPGDKLWRGSIKFPMSTKNVPPVRIYYAGTIIPADTQNSTRQVLFDISESKMRSTFCLIIVDRMDFINEQNTVKYLHVPDDRPYKLYTMEFIPNRELAKAPGHTVDAAQMGTWLVTQKLLAEDRRIPDNTIIVCYHPHLVKSIEGGNGIELPKIILDESILTQLTEEELQDASTQYLLTSLNCDSIHARQNAHIKTDFTKKNIISMICS